MVGLFDLSGAIFHSAALLALYAYLHRNSPDFLRRYKAHSTEKEGSFDRFQTDACSRCGICIDPCQLQSELGIDDVQSVYFLRDRRYNHLRQSVANNCLMCGRCEQRCPVGIELNTLRLNSRDTMRNTPDEKRYEYFQGGPFGRRGPRGLFRRVYDPADAPYPVGDGADFQGFGRRGLVGGQGGRRLLRPASEGSPVKPIRPAR